MTFRASSSTSPWDWDWNELRPKRGTRHENGATWGLWVKGIWLWEGWCYDTYDEEIPLPETWLINSLGIHRILLK